MFLRFFDDFEVGGFARFLKKLSLRMRVLRPFCASTMVKTCRWRGMLALERRLTLVEVKKVDVAFRILTLLWPFR